MKIHTIGYQEATLEGVISALQAAGITQLIDVRALPRSRRPGMSKTALAGAMAEAGIDYVHLQALGTPAAGRNAARKGDRDTLEKVYGDQLELPEAVAAAAVLEEQASKRPSALFCYCRDASKCHRSILRRERLAGFEQVDLLP